VSHKVDVEKVNEVSIGQYMGPNSVRQANSMGT